jgi:hypothetical protein
VNVPVSSSGASASDSPAISTATASMISSISSSVTTATAVSTGAQSGVEFQTPGRAFCARGAPPGPWVEVPTQRFPLLAAMLNFSHSFLSFHFRHGKISTYIQGCRCDECRESWRVYNKAKRETRQAEFRKLKEMELAQTIRESSWMQQQLADGAQGAD